MPGEEERSFPLSATNVSYPPMVVKDYCTVLYQRWECASELATIKISPVKSTSAWVNHLRRNIPCETLFTAEI